MEDRIAAYVLAADAETAAYWERQKYTHSPPPTHRVIMSDKWAKVVVVEHGKDSSVHSFICLKDGATKALGILKAGDIHKAATFKAPAKHARGSIFQEDFGKCLTPFGVTYL